MISKLTGLILIKHQITFVSRVVFHRAAYVIGPVLFLIFINDLFDIFGSGLTVKLFADDVKSYAIFNDVKCQ